MVPPSLTRDASSHTMKRKPEKRLRTLELNSVHPCRDDAQASEDPTNNYVRREGSFYGISYRGEPIVLQATDMIEALLRPHHAVEGDLYVG